MVEDQRLNVAFVWLVVQENKIGLAEKDVQIGETLDKEKINLRVYGES
jgi:hypothetical protein